MVNASDGEPEAEGSTAPAPRPRRSWPRRAFRAIVGVTLALLLLGALALLLLHSPVGRTAARAALEAWGSRAVGGTLRIGQLELALWRGHAGLTAVTLALPGTALDVQHVDVDWSPRSGARVSLLRPRVVVTEVPGEPPSKRPATGLAARPWQALSRLTRAELVEGRVELRDAKGAPWLVLGRVDAEMPDASRRLAFRVADGALGWPEGGLRLEGVSAEGAARLDGGHFTLERAHVSAGQSALDLEGGLERILPTSGTATARAAFDGALVEAVVPGTHLEARVTSEASVEVADDRLTGTLSTASPALTLAGLGPWQVTGRGRIEGAALVLDALVAHGFGGELQATGPLALLASARTDVELRASGLDAGALARALGAGEIPVSARGSGSLRWATQGFELEAGRGEGQLALQAGAGRGLKPAGTATLRIRGRSLALADASVAVRGARVAGDAEIDAHGALRGSWSGDLPLLALPGLLGDLGSSAQPPELGGRLVATGTLGGSLSDPAIAARVTSEAVVVRGRPLALEGEVGAQQGRLSLAPLVLRCRSGRATFTGGVPLAAAGDWDVAGDVDALEVEAALALLGLDGHGTASGTLRVSGPRDAPIGRASLRGSVFLPRTAGAATPAAGPAASRAPAEDEVALSLEAGSRGGHIDVDELRAELAGGSVDGKLSYDPASSSIAIHAKAEGLAWERLPLLPASARELTGTLAGEVDLTGRTQAPEGTLHLTLAEARLGEAKLDPFRLEARSDGHELSVTGREGEAVLLRGKGPLEGAWPLGLEIDAAALPLQTLLDAHLGSKEEQATLAAGGTLAVELPLRDPGTLRYSSSDLALTGRLRRLDWRIAPFSVKGDRDSLELAGLKLEAGSAWLAAHGRAGLAAASPFDFEIEGNLDFAALAPATALRTLDGDGTLKLHVGGTRESPRLDGALRLADLRGRFGRVRVNDLDAEARFEGRELRVERLEASVLGGTLSGSGGIALVGEGGGTAPRFAFEVKDVDLAQLLDRELREAADSPSLLVSLDGELGVVEPKLASVSAHGRLTRLESRSVEGALALTAPTTWSLERGVFASEPIRLEGPLGSLEARLTGRADGARPSGQAALSGQVDLRALSPFLRETTVSGPVTIDARASYGAGALRLDGSVKVEKGRVSLDALNFTASDLAGELRLEGDRMSLEAEAASGDGRLHATGGMQLGRSLLGVADFELTAERVPLSYPVGFRGRANGAVRLTGEPGRYRIAGDVDVNQSSFTADFDPKSQSLDRLDWQLAALDGGSLTDQIALAVNVRLAEPLRVRNSTMQVDLEGTLAASGTLAQPTVEGVVSLREGGELTLGRARVRVSEGRIVLNGYPAEVPELDFQGATRVSGIALELRARGALDDLQLTLSSDRSDLSQTDLVTLLLTGRTAAAAASQGGVVVAEQLAVALGGVLQKGVGDTLLIDVAPDRSLLTEDTDPTQRLHIGTRIMQNLTVLYSVALDGTAKRWIVEVNPGGGRFRFRGITEEDNTFSVEGTDRFSFELWNRGRRVGKAPREVERLASLRFEGTLPVAEPELRRAVKLKPGRRYSGLQREQAADRVRERLAREGYRSAGVEALSRPGAGGVELVLRVEAGPLVRFAWSGDDPGGKTKKQAEQALSAVATPDAAAAQVARAALHRLQKDGYYGASVVPQATSAEGRVDVALHVARGAKGTGIDVEFDGNEALADTALLATLPKPGSLAFFEALDPRSVRISSSVRLAYAGIGYLRARVAAPRSRFDAATGRLAVTIPVRERTASTVAEIGLPEELKQPGAPPLALKLRQGEPFDLSAYVADRDALVAWYRAQGWIEAQAGATIEARRGSVTVRYEVDAGPRPRIGSVSVVENGYTSSSLIRRSIKLREGGYVEPTALSDSRERLSDLGIYRSVDVRSEARPPGDELRDVTIGLVHKPDVQVEYGLRYTTSGQSSGSIDAAPTAPSDGRIQLAAAVELNNPFGYGVKARGYTFVTKDRQTWGVNLDAATLVGRRIRTQLFVFDDDEDDDFLLAGIDSRVRGVSLQQSRALLRDRRSRRWHDRLRLQWGYTFKNIEYFGTEPGVVQLQGYRGFLSLALIGDERDSLTDPTRGIFWTATSEFARTWLGSDADYVRLYGQFFAFVPIGKLVWAQGLRVGEVPGENALALLENRFRAGGSTTVRGFDQNALGPLAPAGSSLGGQAVVVVNQELRFPIFKDLKGGVFWDAGNVWAFARELDFKDLRQSAGFGLRYMLPFGPIRLEYAWVIDRKPGEAKGRFVFGLGHAF